MSRINTIAGRVSPSGSLIALAPSHRDYVWVLCRCGRESWIRLPSFFQRTKRGCRHCADRVPINEVRAMVRSGLSIEIMARRLRRDAASIRRAMRRHGIKPARACRQPTGAQSSAETRRRAIDLASQHSARYAAEQIGVSERTIVRWRSGHSGKRGAP